MSDKNKPVSDANQSGDDGRNPYPRSSERNSDANEEGISHERLLRYLESFAERYKKPLREVAGDHGISEERLKQYLAEKSDRNGLNVAQATGSEAAEKIMLQRFEKIRAGKKGEDGQER
jgi:hypothetical protein